MEAPSTWIPLMALTALAFFSLQPNSRDLGGFFNSSQPAYIGVTSYQAGLSEEALFRGWIYPLLHQATGERTWLSNSGQSLLFSAAHLGTNSFPWPQLLLGYYFGWMTSSNHWSIGQATFLHTWWDVIAFSAAFISDSGSASFRFQFPLKG
jgi:membrane protease YdiL (CAAX protease family)